MSIDTNVESRYLNLLIEALRKCRDYRPRFGSGGEMALEDFQKLYRADPFYSWFGLNSTEVYRAHRLAGGITSLYRQLGTGCEQLFREILCDTLQLQRKQLQWHYTVPAPGGGERKVTLDAKVDIDEVQAQEQKQLLRAWLRDACSALAVTTSVKGIVFEVRQGYKSKDSKRQQADITSAANAFANGYLPVLLLLSCQIDEDVALRYQSARWLILRGTTEGTITQSTYAFCSDVLRYDLASFFERHSKVLRREVLRIIRQLLR